MKCLFCDIELDEEKDSVGFVMGFPETGIIAVCPNKDCESFGNPYDYQLMKYKLAGRPPK